MKNFKKTMALVLAAVMTVSGISVAAPAEAQAATKPKKITLAKKSATIAVGSTYTIKVKKLTPKKANKAANKKAKKFTYKSSKKKVAKVSKKGKITVKKKGTAKITVTAKANKKAKAKFTVKAKKVTGVKVNATSISLVTGGKTATITAKTKPETTINKGFSFASNNTSVAKVSSKGVVTSGTKAGTATITVTSKNNKKATAKVTVKVTAATVAVSSVTVSPKTASIEVGKTTTLSATVAPSNATNKVVTWKSSDASVASVANGKVTGLKAGTATITATAGGKSDTATITVKAATVSVAVTGITLEPASTSVAVGKTVNLTATVAPENATNKAITWTSSDDAIASVANGVVTGNKKGVATITATSADDATIKATAEVRVHEETESAEATKEGETNVAPLSKDASSFEIKSPAGNFAIDGAELKADSDKLQKEANRVWDIDTVYEILRDNEISSYKTVERILNTKYGSASSKTESSDDYEYKAVEGADEETLTGTAWWGGMQVGTDHAISGDGIWAFKGTASTENADCDASFEIYVPGEPVGSGANHYITSNTDGNSWTAELATAESIENVFDAGNIRNVDGDELLVLIAREGQTFTYTYYKNGVQFIKQTISNTNLPKDCAIHVMAQTGTYKLQFYKVEKKAVQNIVKTLKLGADTYTLNINKDSAAKKIDIDVTGAKTFQIADLKIKDETEASTVHEMTFNIVKGDSSTPYTFKIHKGQNHVQLFDNEDLTTPMIDYQETDDSYVLKTEDKFLTKLAMNIEGFVNPFEGMVIDAKF